MKKPLDILRKDNEPIVCLRKCVEGLEERNICAVEEYRKTVFL